jgi:hypothetical protein
VLSSHPIARCWTKAISEEVPGRIVRSQKWVVARRTWLRIYGDHLECGDWNIPFEITSGIVLYKGWQFPWRVKVLEVVVGTHAYHFGLNPWCRIESHLRTQFRTEELHLKHSPFSIAVRVAALAYLGYLIWEQFS